MFTVPRSGGNNDLLSWATDLIIQLRREKNAGWGGSIGTGPLSEGGIGPSLVPPGCVMDWAGLTEPEGWAFCDGRALAKDAYSELFGAIGDRWTVGGSPSDLFNIPDFRQRVSMWRDGWEDAGTAFGGADEITLTEDQLPVVDLGLVLLEHTHEYNDTASIEIDAIPFSGGTEVAVPTGVPGVTSVSSSSVAIAFGAAEAIPALPLYYSVPRIIKL